MRRRILLAAALLLPLGACVSHGTATDFTRPDPARIILGQTTEAEILALYGPSTSRSSTGAFTASPFDPPDANPAPPGPTRSTLVYARSNTLAFPISQTNHKRLSFTLVADRLAAYQFTSDVPEDSTDFDTTKAAAILAGGRAVTRDAILAALGVPTARAIPPATPAAVAQRIGYTYAATPPFTRTIVTKRLFINLDAADHVIDYQLNEDTRALPPLPTPTFNTIIIPRHR